MSAAIAEAAGSPARAADRRLSARARNAVAAAAPVAVAMCFLHFGSTGQAFVGGFFAVVLIYLAAFDLEHRLIPNRVVLPATVIVVAASVAISPDRALELLAAAAAASAFFFVTLLVYPPGLGMGDVKLGLLLGGALGTHVVGALLIGTIAAAVFGAILVVRDGATARRRAIAFGPFLAFGGVLALFLS